METKVVKFFTSEFTISLGRPSDMKSMAQFPTFRPHEISWTTAMVGFIRTESLYTPNAAIPLFEQFLNNAVPLQRQFIFSKAVDLMTVNVHEV
jgi:hypothetical protein